MSELPHVFDATTETFEAEVLRKSLDVPVLVDFWATWCGPCKTLSPILEKLAGEYNGAFLLAKVDVDKEQQIAAAFQIRSVPTVFLVKGGQLVDGFPGALPEGQLREFLASHGVVPAEGALPEEEQAPLDPQAQVAALREAISAEPDKDELKLDLVLALLRTGEAPEALRTAVQTNPDDLRARHLLGVHALVAGDSEQALEQFLDMLKRDRAYEDGLARKSLIDAFRVIEDEALVSQYRRKMSSLLF